MQTNKAWRLILSNTSPHLPFITPPSATVRKHAIPQGTVALTAVPSDGASIKRKHAAHVLRETAAHDGEAKSTAIKGMIFNQVGRPTAATAKAVTEIKTR